jgi:hypothetical protein
MLELAIMAAGVPFDKVYPIDMKLALDKFKEIKEHCIYWNSGAESEQVIRTGEAVMGAIWHTRASVLSRESNDRMSWTWNQAVLQPGIFVVPKGNPAGAIAQALLASMTAKPEPQIGLLGVLGKRDRFLGRVRTGAGNDRYAALGLVDAPLDHLVVLGVRERRAFAGGADRNKPARTLGDLPVDEAAKGFLVQGPVLERRDQRGE